MKPAMISGLIAGKKGSLIEKVLQRRESEGKLEKVVKTKSVKSKKCLGEISVDAKIGAKLMTLK
jgi:hypothetical protein